MVSPLSTGVVHDTRAEELPAVATTLPGAPGPPEVYASATVTCMVADAVALLAISVKLNGKVLDAESSADESGMLPDSIPCLLVEKVPVSVSAPFPPFHDNTAPVMP